MAIVARLTLLGGYLSYRFGTAQLLYRLDADPLPGERAPRLYRRLDALCDGYDVAVPRILVADLSTPNAFALGGGRGGSLVLDRSVFYLLDADELEGIPAHELAHLERYDALLQTLAFSTIRTIGGFLLVAILPLLLLATGFAQAVARLRGRPGS